MKAECCEKIINEQEYIINHGMCDGCMDKGLDEANKRQVLINVNMSEEMKKIVDRLIAEYEDIAMGEEMTEWQKQLFRDAFMKGVDFAENIGTYL